MIDNIELSAFMRENLALARTIVIKNEDLALLDNRLMARHYNFDSGEDKSQWRYYLNLNGDYHVTDEIMMIKSLDDNEMIEFTKANLENHPATKKAYRLGGYYFSRLVAKFPHQMELIQGIINPITPDEAIPAKPYQILRYTKEYIEWNESQLIPKLQDFINQTAYQSFNTEYKYTDDLMLPMLIAHLSEGIYKFLLTCRFEHRFSRHAHSFYIWSYLQSKGISPIYKSLLNRKQTLWLFRNIDYVLRNLGKSGTFTQLIDILLTERNIPLSKYDLIQSTETMKDDLHSEPLFFSERLNLIETKGLAQKSYSISQTMNKEVPESLDNALYYDKYLPTTTEESIYGERVEYPIKVLDSELVDTTNRKTETLFNVLNNELIYLAGKEFYNINLDIEDPVSGIHQRLTVKECVVLWHHLLNLYNGAQCDTIPEFFYRDVLKITPPTVDTMLSVGTPPFLTKDWCQDVLKTYIPQIKIISPSIFYENALAIFNLKWVHEKMYSRWLSIGYHAQRKNAISTLYETGFVKLTEIKTYSEFLTHYDFDFTTYRKEDYFSLMWEIWRKMTGWDQFSHITIGQIQSGMIGLMKFLSSYSVQYIYQTTIEDGWYEGGIDLFTENPGILNSGDEGKPELESINESNRIPVHHRVVTDEELEETFYLDNRLDHGTIDSEIAIIDDIYETPNVYDVELDDNDKDDGFHSNLTVAAGYVLRVFTGDLPYQLEDLIPTGGERAAEYVLNEMIIDKFEGLQQVGPWVAKGIWIVDNKGLDNLAVALDVGGFDYVKIMETKTIVKEGVNYNQYYIGFIPALLDSNVIKLDVIAEHIETNAIVHIRFDYTISTKTNKWAISFDIPKTVTLNQPFNIDKTITDLSLNNEIVVAESYYVHPDVNTYLTVNTQMGVQGEFIKAGWPEKLPLLYLLQTKRGDNNDERLNEHYYYLQGLIPSDRYYNPLTDSEFEPKGVFFEGDTNFITVEQFEVTAKYKGWEAVDLYIKKNEDGSYPTDLVKTDYAGITNYLAPHLSEKGFFDKTIEGKTIRVFEWLYVPIKEDIELTLILELKNEEGEVVLREFNYAPIIYDHDVDLTFTFYPTELYKFGIDYTTNTHLTVMNVQDGFTLSSGVDPVMSPLHKGNVVLEYDPTQMIDGNEIYGYEVRPYDVLNEDVIWALQVEGRLKTPLNNTLIIRPYGIVTLYKEDVVNYDTIDVSELDIVEWGNNTAFSHAIVPIRYAMKDTFNGWQQYEITIKETDNGYPDFISTTLPGIDKTTEITGINPSIKMGNYSDGKQDVPAYYDHWFTMYFLANREYLNGETKTVQIPLLITLSNKYSDKIITVEYSVNATLNGTEFTTTNSPDTLKAGETNHIIPKWENYPLKEFGETPQLISSEGIFIGVNHYIGGISGEGRPTYHWNSTDQSAYITLPAPPLKGGNGIKVYNKAIYRSNLSEFTGTSLQDVTYYPFIEYTDDEILKVVIPTLEDFDFTLLSSDLFQGVTCTLGFLFDTKVAEKNEWKCTVNGLNAYGKDNQSDVMITSMFNTDLPILRTHYYGLGVTPSDVPADKTSYKYGYIKFIPAKAGKQTISIDILAVNKLSSVNDLTLTFEVEIDVNPNEGKVAYKKRSSKNSNVYFPINDIIQFDTEVSDYTGILTKSTLFDAIPLLEDNEFINTYRIINSAYNNPRLDIIALKDFEEKDRKFIIMQDAEIENENYSNDVRNQRTYYSIITISHTLVYSLDDVTLERFDFQPDVIFETMEQFTSYFERYTYLKDRYFGWTIDERSKIVEDTDWMNHIYEYQGNKYVGSSLFSTIVNQSKDIATYPPSDKVFYFAQYGGKVVGEYEVIFNILLSSNAYQYGSKIETKTVQYKQKRKIISNPIEIEFEPSKLKIGEKNDVVITAKNIPGPDVPEGLNYSATYYDYVGRNKKQFTMYTYPSTVLEVNANYVIGSGGVKIVLIYLYRNNKIGYTIDSKTKYRYYHAEKIINDDDLYIDDASESEDNLL